jgi:hypothetical protein
MTEARRTALRDCLIAVAFLAPAVAFLWAVDYVPSFRHLEPPTALAVGFIAPFSYLLVKAVYRLVTGQVLNWPPKVDLNSARRR